VRTANIEHGMSDFDTLAARHLRHAGRVASIAESVAEGFPS
jgi:hypothetical protein